jgi:hypothetical protein
MRGTRVGGGVELAVGAVNRSGAFAVGGQTEWEMAGCLRAIRTVCRAVGATQPSQVRPTLSLSTRSIAFRKGTRSRRRVGTIGEGWR